MEVIRGMKLCCFLDGTFKGVKRVLVSSRSRSKLPVDRTVLRDGGDVMAEEGDRRLLSLEKPSSKIR